MQQRENLTHMILVLVLTPLMIAVAAQAQITFVSNRDGHVHPRLGWPTSEIYVMDADGGNPQKLTNHPRSDSSPAWLNSPFSVSLAGKKFTIWGRLKQVD